MVQENRLQNFKLPEPVVCIGGIMQVELLGRVERKTEDEDDEEETRPGLFYICINHVQIVGRPMEPAFSADIHDDPCKTSTLKVLSYDQPSPPEAPSTNSSFYVQNRVRDLRQIVNTLRGGDIYLPDYVWEERIW